MLPIRSGVVTTLPCTTSEPSCVAFSRALSREPALHSLLLTCLPHDLACRRMNRRPRA